MTTSRFREFRGVQVCACAAVALILALPAVSQAQQATPSGEELYIDRLGCWNCHGSAGEGGSGPGLNKTQVPLWQFAKYVRLPSGEMPAVSSVLASDEELAILYQWLGGVDAVKVPPPVTFAVRGGPGTEMGLTARTRAAASGAGTLDTNLLRYRVTLLTRADGPVANQEIQCHVAGRDTPSTFTTDGHGQALLGAEAGFFVADRDEADKGEPASRLRVVLPAGRYALVVEALEGAESANPVVVGVGTAVFTVQ